MLFEKVLNSNKYGLVCMMFEESLKGCHPEWLPLILGALEAMSEKYLSEIQQSENWLPGVKSLFSAFSLSLTQTRYILFGESPYPRKLSANGYAFWDATVHSLWSDSGLSKEVNKATSLRNWMKALLVASGKLQVDVSQKAIAAIDKSTLVQTSEELFTGMMGKGILLLNASLVFAKGQIPYHAKHWRPFMEHLLNQLAQQSIPIQLILFGKIADNLPQHALKVALRCEHPYNVSFIHNRHVIAFFNPLDLLTNAN